jgi:Acetyltransferase (GNAT) domain
MISSICSKDSKLFNQWKRIFTRNQTWNLEVVADLDQVPQEFWKLADARENGASPFIKKPYLQAMSVYCRTWVVLFRKKGQPVGYAIFYLSTFQTAELQTGLSKCWGFRDWAAKRWANTSRPQHVLVCGNPLVSGEHGFVFSNEESPNDKADVLCDAMNLMVSEVEKNGIDLNICIIKDFYPQQQWLLGALGKCGFSPLQGDPVMMLPIAPRWKNQIDYQQDLISKFRSKSITAYHKSSRLTKEYFSVEDMMAQSSDWYPLYEQVYQRAQYKWKKLTAEAIIQWKKALGDDAIMQVYKLDGRIVGFSILFLGKSEMEAHMVGIDYEFNKEYQLYSRMLYDFIEQGIEAKMRYISFGRTAVEIKSSVGALPLPAIALMRHSSSMTNVLVRWLVSMFKPERAELRQVWKQDTHEELIDLLNKR